MKIQVTQEDINNGKRANIHYCPIALAVQRATGNKEAVCCACTVYNSVFDNNGFKLPTNAISALQQFDTGQYITPFEFELEIQ